VGSIKQDILDVIGSVSQVNSAVEVGKDNAKETEVNFSNIQEHIQEMMERIGKVDSYSESLSTMTQNIFTNTDELASDVELTAESATVINDLVLEHTDSLHSFEVELKNTAVKIVGQ